MTVYHLIDALPAAFFGLLGIWAAVVRRHWFLRFVVVSVFLLALLLIPAFEVVIEFGLAVGFIAMAVWLARGRPRETFRFSLESALLAMVVVAVILAVVAKAPEFGWQEWFRLLNVAIAVASASLLSLWLVSGKARLRYRLTFTSLGLTIFVSLFYFCAATHYLLLEPEWSYGWLERVWIRASDPDVRSWGIDHCIPVVFIGFTTLVCVLLLARASGWFTGNEEINNQPHAKITVIARVGLATMLLGIFIPLAYVFWCLMTPTPYPATDLPSDSSWDQLVAAGERIDPNSLQHIRSGSRKEAEAAMVAAKPAFDAIDDALSDESFAIRKYHDVKQAQEDSWAIWQVHSYLLLRLHFAAKFETKERLLEEVEAALDFCSHFGKDASFRWWVDAHVERYCLHIVRRKLPTFDVSQCRRIVGMLGGYDHRLGSPENRIQHQRLYDENAGWLNHIQLLLKDWADEEPYAFEAEQYLNRIRHLRMLTIRVALQQYFLDQRELPDSLDEIVPKYLSTIPTDPVTADREFLYRKYWGGYALVTQDENPDDVAIVAGPAAPYLWQRLQESWQQLQGWLQTFPATTAPR